MLIGGARYLLLDPLKSRSHMGQPHLLLCFTIFLQLRYFWLLHRIFTNGEYSTPYTNPQWFILLETLELYVRDAPRSANQSSLEKLENFHGIHHEKNQQLTIRSVFESDDYSRHLCLLSCKIPVNFS